MSRRCTLVTFSALALIGASALAQDLAQPTEFRVKLLGPISTETNQKGDKITAQVLTPAQYRGAIMEGEIKESKSGGKIKGTSVLNFSFDTLVRGSQRVPVKSSVDSVYNSKGKENVDEEGRVIRKKNNLGKAAIATGAGILVMDEPLSHVNRALRRECWHALRKACAERGASLVFSSHDAETILREAEHVICLDRGRVAWSGPVAELYASPATRELAEFVGPVNWFEPEEAALWLNQSFDRPRGSAGAAPARPRGTRPGAHRGRAPPGRP